MPLKERIFKCGSCGHSMDSYLNAAINLSQCVAGVPPVVAPGVSRLAKA
ncbi:MAG: hypothetical protein VKL59_23140 [Nostocaceae cyanobacterium]|nr:hypothetical protein [Nostocaceae cyanobacterium]